MKKITTSLAMLLFLVFSMQAQMDGLTFEKFNASESLKEYNIAYLNGMPATTGKSGYKIKSDYAYLYYIQHIMRQKFMTVDSLLSANDVANKQKWYGDYIARRRTGATDEDQRMISAYDFDQKIRELLSFNLSPNLVKRFLATTDRPTSGKFTTWSGSGNQFEIKKAYEDFLGSKTLENIKKDLASFNLIDELVFVAYGAIGNFDFNAKTLQFNIGTQYLDFSKTLKGTGGTLECKVEMSEEDAQEIMEKKFFRALIPVKPSAIEVSTIKEFMKEPIDRKHLMTELNGNEIELVGNHDVQDKIITINVNTCTTR